MQGTTTYPGKGGEEVGLKRLVLVKTFHASAARGVGLQAKGCRPHQQMMGEVQIQPTDTLREKEAFSQVLSRCAKGYLHKQHHLSYSHVFVQKCVFAVVGIEVTTHPHKLAQRRTKDRVEGGTYGGEKKLKIRCPPWYQQGDGTHNPTEERSGALVLSSS